MNLFCLHLPFFHFFHGSFKLKQCYEKSQKWNLNLTYRKLKTLLLLPSQGHSLRLFPYQLVLI